ncbi:MAG: translocation/assembly module TamB domain-containing protein [Desulfuromonadales bacterium]|nr:translocation/assembly module TamB domain-containing protein [Desulfuromonadales bacterium]
MRRRILSICVLLVFLALILIGGFGSWLLRSPSGASWLIETIADATDMQVTIGQLDGRLADELFIEELVLAWPKGELSARRIHLEWQPFSLLQQKLNIRTLETDQLVVRTTIDADQAEGRADEVTVSPFAASDLAFLPVWLTVQIDHLQVEGVALQNDSGGVVIADEISGRYLWSRQQLKASEFRYLSPFVQLRGAFDWDLQQPHLLMTADVHLPDTLIKPQLFEDIAVPIDFPAQLSLDGDWNDFSGPVRFGKVADVAGNVWLTAEAQGSWQGIRFDNLQGRYLNGDLAGNLQLAWIDSYRMNGELTGSGLDPGVLIKELDGRARLDVSGELLVPYDGRPLQASLGAVIHEGQLRGHAVAGNVAADWRDGGLHAINLDLTGEGARVIAKGKPAERLELDLAVDDLSPFYPDLAGQLTASGWLRWVDGYLTGEVQGSAANIVWQDTSFASLNFNARHLAQQAPLALQVNGQSFQYGKLQAEQLQLVMNGTLEQHDLRIMVNGLGAELALQLAGQYRDEVWQAKMQTLSAQVPELGSWNLEGPAHLSWQSGVINLEGASLVSQSDEHVTLKVTDWGGTEHAQLATTWQNLRHAWLAYLLPSHTISGRSSGELSLDMAAQQPVSLKARVTADAEWQNDFSMVTVPVLTAEAAWLKDGLDLKVVAESDTGEHFELAVHSSESLSWQWPPEQLSLDMRWQGVKLERLSYFRKDLDIQGQSAGHAQLEIMAGQLLQVSATVSAEGLMQQWNQPVGFRSLLADLNWDDRGFQCNAHIEGAHEGILDLSLTSTDSPRLAWPVSGRIGLEVANLKLQSLNPLLPDKVEIDGVINGKSGGYWLDDGQIVMDGQLQLADSGVTLHNSGGQINIQVSQAAAEWQWQGDQLAGSLSLQLAREGQLQGNWQLPLPARWPIDFVEEGALQASLQGQLRATGILAALAPGLIQDLHGQIKGDLQVAGSWLDPVFSGELALLDAGAYVPATGVTIKDFEVRTVLQGTQLKIEEFSLRSGPGTLSGSGMIGFDRWQLQNYRLMVEGERLQIYNFPELQVLCSPELTLSGDLETLRLEGRLLIPELSLLEAETAPEVLPSDDVVIAGEDQEGRKALPIDADIQVAVELGENVRVRTAGVATRLQGGGRITLDEQNHVVFFGEITLAKGVYKAYGANLDIKQGVLTFAGGAVDNPRLNILATREVGTVQAGVQVTGTAEAPVVTLYSQPAMPERDILGYIFMGRPMREGQEGEDALMISAGALLPGYGGTFSDLGISEIDIQGLFAGTGGVTLRKRLSEKWEVESTLGVESGVDLYYLIKFD